MGIFTFIGICVVAVAVAGIIMFVAEEVHYAAKNTRSVEDSNRTLHKRIEELEARLKEEKQE